MTPQPTKAREVEVYELLLRAAMNRQSITAVYDDLPRLLCPHVLGRKGGRLQVLFYQFGGSSRRGLQANPWRCLAVDKLSQVACDGDHWHTEPRSGRPTCIDEIDFDVDTQPDPTPPQNGQ